MVISMLIRRAGWL